VICDTLARTNPYLSLFFSRSLRPSLTQESSWEVPEGYLPPTTEGEEAQAVAGEEVTWTDDVSVQGSGQDWVEETDPASGAVYYSNTITGETSWDVPVGFGSAPVPVTKTRSCTPTPPGTPPKAVSASATAEVPTADVPLSDAENPENWEAIWDDDNGMYYYMNHALQTTQWEMPDCINPEKVAIAASLAAEAASEQAAAAAAANAAADATAAEGANDEGSRDQSPAAAGDTAGTKSGRRGGTTTNGTKEAAVAIAAAAATATTVNIKSSSPQEQKFADGFDFALLDQVGLVESVPGQEASTHHKRQSAIVADLFNSAEESRADPTEDSASKTMEVKALMSDSAAPVVDITLLKLNASLGEISTFLGDIKFTQFVEKHFRTEGQATVVSSSTKNKLMSWTNEPAALSLCMMNESELVESAVMINRIILGYMQDRVTHKPQSEFLNLLLLEILHGGDRIRDEMFCQIIRQLHNNPDPRSEERGWHLLIICLACVPPSKYFAPYLMAFCINVAQQIVLPSASQVMQLNRRVTAASRFSAAAFDDEDDGDKTQLEAVHMNSEFRRMSELCSRYVMKAVKSGSHRTHSPTQAEITALINGESQHVKVYAAKKQISVPIDSWTTVHDCETRISSQLGLREDNRYIFCLHEQVKSSSNRAGEYDEHPLQGYERAVDILSFHAADAEGKPAEAPLPSLDGEMASSGGDGAESATGGGGGSGGGSGSVGGAATPSVPQANEGNLAYRFIYKGRLFLDANILQGSLANIDPVCTYLLYLQAKEDVMSSRYPISRADAVLLAALSLQESLGDYYILQTKLGYQSRKQPTISQIAEKAALASAATSSSKGVSFEENLRQKQNNASAEMQSRAALSLLGIGDLASASASAKGSAEAKNADTEAAAGEGEAEDPSAEADMEIRTDFFRHHPIDTVISKHYMGGVMDESRRKLAEKDVARVYSTLVGVNPEQARLHYMTCVRACRVYGAHYYSVTTRSDVSSDSTGREEIMAITSRNIIFIDALTQTISSELNHKRILSWGYSRDSVMLELSPRVAAGHALNATATSNTPFKSGSGLGAGDEAPQTQAYKMFYKSRSAKEIADLLQSYNAHLR